jgi:hypothetical protein
VLALAVVGGLLLVGVSFAQQNSSIPHTNETSYLFFTSYIVNLCLYKLNNNESMFKRPVTPWSNLINVLLLRGNSQFALARRKVTGDGENKKRSHQFLQLVVKLYKNTVVRS